MLIWMKCLQSVLIVKEKQVLKKSGLEDFYDKIITLFVINSMLHRVGRLCMISSKEEMDYDNFTNSKNLGWFDTGPWHKKNICSK